jgi:hypothetical protein
MQKGDNVMVNHPESHSREFVRSYGIIHEITKAGGVIIEMADGSLIKPHFSSVAVYVHPPENWDELFQQQQIIFSQPKPRMMSRTSSLKKNAELIPNNILTV